MAKSKKKNYLFIVLIVLALSLAVGYAAFGQTLNINGTATANGNFELKFISSTIENAVGTDGSSTSISANGDTLSISMQLKYPGAGGIVNAKIKNTGNITAQLNSVDFTGNTDPDINVSFVDFTEDEVIEPGAEKDVSIIVNWVEGSQEAKSIKFSATLNYSQYTENFNVSNENENNG